MEFKKQFNEVWKKISMAYELVKGAPTTLIVCESDGHMTPLLIEDKVPDLVSAGMAIARAEKDGNAKPNNVFLVSETWYTKAKKGKEPECMPSQDKNRKEALVMVGIELSTKKKHFRMVEVKKGKIIGKPINSKITDTEKQAVILQPFLLAYEGSKLLDKGKISELIR